MKRKALSELNEKERYTIINELIKEFGIKNCGHLLVELLKNDDHITIGQLIQNKLLAVDESLHDEQIGHNPLLHLAISYNSNKCVKELVKLGANIKLKSYNGNLPLMLAFLHENNEAILAMV